jgi:hypothetical protein
MVDPLVLTVPNQLEFQEFSDKEWVMEIKCHRRQLSRLRPESIARDICTITTTLCDQPRYGNVYRATIVHDDARLIISLEFRGYELLSITTQIYTPENTSFLPVEHLEELMAVIRREVPPYSDYQPALTYIQAYLPALCAVHLLCRNMSYSEPPPPPSYAGEKLASVPN